MFIFGNFFNAVAGLINMVLTIYMWIIFIRAVISWFSPDPYNPLVHFLYTITDPVLNLVRRTLPRVLWSTGIDFSPFIVILVILFLQAFLVRSLIEIGMRFR